MEAERNGDAKRALLPVDKTSACATTEDEFPPGTTKFECQVAGHSFDPRTNKIGMLRGKNGHVLKSCEKPLLQEREIAFYEAMKNSDDPIYKELSLFAPKYFGIMETTFKSRPIKFIVLKDITEGMTEPCVMDVKIGRCTWDPLASPEKREADDRKYAASKRAYGFCIPGFQVYNLASGQLRKYNKDYMKKLDATGVVDALRMFLNAEPGELPNRELIVNLLSYLWKILAFFRAQKTLRFFSSSLLIVYDAKRLQSCLRTGVAKDNQARAIETRGTKTFASCDIGLSGQLTSNGPTLDKTAKSLMPLASTPPSAMVAKSNRVRAIVRLNRLKRSASLTGCDFPANATNSSGQQKNEPTIQRSGSFGRGLNDSFSPLCRTHSFTNNYDRDIKEMKEDYAELLENLTGKSRKRRDWVRINMIDFTHVFNAENDSTDANYLEGIENLVKILETFLR